MPDDYYGTNNAAGTACYNAAVNAVTPLYYGGSSGTNLGTAAANGTMIAPPPDADDLQSPNQVHDSGAVYQSIVSNFNVRLSVSNGSLNESHARKSAV